VASKSASHSRENDLRRDLKEAYKISSKNYSQLRVEHEGEASGQAIDFLRGGAIKSWLAIALVNIDCLLSRKHNSELPVLDELDLSVLSEIYDLDAFL